jgi:hypothetical protein
MHLKLAILATRVWKLGSELIASPPCILFFSKIEAGERDGKERCHFPISRTIV